MSEIQDVWDVPVPEGSPAERVVSYLRDRGVSLKFKFVPLSKSKVGIAAAKRGDEVATRDLCVNWEVTLQGQHRAFTTSFVQGTGHLPDSLQPREGRYAHLRNYTLPEEERVRWALESGNIPIGDSLISRGPLPAPSAASVVQCLLLDAQALDYSFEDWAAEYGYSSDSREAEAIYNQCVQSGLELRRLLGEDALSALGAIVQDY